MSEEVWGSSAAPLRNSSVDADAPDWRRLGHALHSARVRLGLSQQTAAVLARISQRTWVRLEQGVDQHASVRTVRGAARAVGLSPEQVCRWLFPEPRYRTEAARALRQASL